MKSSIAELIAPRITLCKVFYLYFIKYISYRKMFKLISLDSCEHHGEPCGTLKGREVAELRTLFEGVWWVGG